MRLVTGARRLRPLRDLPAQSRIANPTTAGNDDGVELRRVADIKLGFYDDATLRQAARGADPKRQYLDDQNRDHHTGCDSRLKKSLAWSAGLVGSDPLEWSRPYRFWLHVLMATFRSNGGVPLVMISAFAERLSTCNDRPYPTSDARGASQI